MGEKEIAVKKKTDLVKNEVGFERSEMGLGFSLISLDLLRDFSWESNLCKERRRRRRMGLEGRRRKGGGKWGKGREREREKWGNLENWI